MSCKFIVYIRLFIYFEKFSVNIGINKPVKTELTWAPSKLKYIKYTSKF